MLQLQVIGNIGRTPSVQTNAKGIEFISFSIAANGSNGETTWVSVIAHKSDGLLPYLTKGKQVFAQGHAWVEMYNNTPVVNMRADRIELCGRASDTANEDPSNEVVEQTF